MLYHLIAVLSLGIVAALAVYVARHWVGGRLPGYAYPIAVGAAMLAYNVWAEYDWYHRTSALLPAHIEVVETYETSAVLQPWTYLVPRINRFVAVDLSSKRRNEKAPGLVLASMLLIKRFEPTIEITSLFDCGNNRAAEIGPGVSFSAQTGLPDNVKWDEDETRLKALEKVCKGENPGENPAAEPQE